jgi:hypothetical protein
MQCPACRVPKEMPQHFLLECLTYASKRWKLRLKDRKKEIKFAEILMSKTTTVALTQYITASSRFITANQGNANAKQQLQGHNTWQ